MSESRILLLAYLDATSLPSIASRYDRNRAAKESEAHAAP